MTSFILENVSVPPEVEQAIDKRSSMAAVGNLNDYVKYQMAQGMASGGSGVGGIGAEMAVGMSMAQQMMNQPGGVMAQTTPPQGAPPAGIPRKRSGQPTRLKALRSFCGTTSSRRSTCRATSREEESAMQWRITRSAVTDFLK
jgi:membrane protease subunit (stomatin/prohibitin family)